VNSPPNLLDSLKIRFYDSAMETTMSVTEATRNFSDLINRVVYRGDTAVLTRNGNVVARIVPERLQHVTGLRFAEMWKELPRLSPEEAEEYARDMEESRRLFNQPPRDPWAQ